MARITRPFRIRLYGKKRGHRRTGSRQLASAGEALFFGVLLLVGAVGLSVLLVSWVLPHWEANYNYVNHTCKVVQRELISHPDGKQFRPSFVIEYDVDGQPYRQTAYDANQVFSSDKQRVEKILERYEIGHEYDCWVSPDNPTQVVLVRTSGWWLWLLLLIPISFVAIGGGGLVITVFQWRTSGERRAFDFRLRIGDFGLENAQSAIPNPQSAMDSPGTKLAYRLPQAGAPALKLLGALAFCFVWNGIVVAFMILAVSRHLGGPPDWRLDVFIAPFAIIGGWLIFWLVTQARATAGGGPTVVEISDHPLHPGDTYELLISQSGRATIELFRVLLVCEEEACYWQGTDMRTDCLRVHEQNVLEQEQLQIDPAEPFVHECSLTIPAGAMHSFKSGHNEIRWSLVVLGRQAGRPALERRFPLVVFPLRISDFALPIESSIPIPNPKSAIRDPQSAIRDPQSAIRNPRSAIPNPQSAIRNQEPLISIQVDGASRVFEPGDVLSGAVQIDVIDPLEIQSAELSVLWYTEGKGDEDIGVHHFVRRMADGNHRGHLHELYKFHTTLPVSPLSYDGVNVKICWCVRLRLFLTQGRRAVSEQRFQLGNVPTAHAVIESSGADCRQPPSNEKARQDTSA